MSWLTAAQTTLASACEQVRVFLECNMHTPILLKAYHQLGKLEALPLGSPQFDACVARFQQILLDEPHTSAANVIDDASGTSRRQPAAAFAELIQRLWVCETVAFAQRAASA